VKKLFSTENVQSSLVVKIESCKL